ncbi:Putative secreted glycosyl hydrolase, partial [hydrothermal vent metagenome]
MIFKRTLIAITLFSLTLSSTLFAEEGAASLFDGKTLKGWIQKNGTATYRVENGTIIGKTTPGSPNSFLCTEKEYGDFELTLEAKLFNSELNSGIQIRSKAKNLKGKKMFGRVNGPQVEFEATGSKGAES